MKISRLLLMSLVLALAPAFAAATAADDAKAAYMRGAAKEKAQDYQGAIAEYEAALKAYPGYFYANKQIGNCDYRLGKASEAIEQYDIYLAKAPNDAATKNFANALRAKQGAAPSPKKEAAAKGDGEMGLNPAFYLGFGFGMISNDGSDLTKGSTGASVALGLNFLEELHLGYQWPSGLAVEGGYQNFNRLATVTYGSSSGGGGIAYVIGDTTFFVEPLYRFQASRRITLDGGLQLGYTSASLTCASAGGSSSGSASTSALALSGSGVTFMPEGRVNFMLGRRVGLHLGAGYRIATITVKGSSASSSSGGSSSSAGSGELNNGGLTYKLGLDIFFSRVVN